MATQTRAAESAPSRPGGGTTVFAIVLRGVGLIFTLVGRLILALYLIAEAGVNGVADLFVRRRQAQARVKAREESVVRFDTHQRIQHILMFTSFLTLAFTGLPQKLYYWDVSQWTIMAMGGLEMTQRIHRIAGAVMLLDCVYHAIYLVHRVIVRRQVQALNMVPMPKDLLDAFHMFRYFLGLTDQKPRFGRFSYLEKFDYWAVFWGIAIIGGSGIILSFPVQVSRIVPGGIVPVAHAAHSDEALLAVAWIFIVHFFYAHFAPHIFPFNTTIFTGRMSKHRLAEEHALEYEKIYGEPAPEHNGSAPQPAQPALAATGACPAEGDGPSDEGR